MNKNNEKLLLMKKTYKAESWQDSKKYLPHQRNTEKYLEKQLFTKMWVRVRKINKEW